MKTYRFDFPGYPHQLRAEVTYHSPSHMELAIVDDNPNIAQPPAILVTYNPEAPAPGRWHVSTTGFEANLGHRADAIHAAIGLCMKLGFAAVELVDVTAFLERQFLQPEPSLCPHGRANCWECSAGPDEEDARILPANPRLNHQFAALTA